MGNIDLSWVKLLNMSSYIKKTQMNTYSSATFDVLYCLFSNLAFCISTWVGKLCNARNVNKYLSQV